MAAGSLPKPGDKYGPCVEQCTHTECMSTRELAEKICLICEKPIGYGVNFYQDGTWKVLTHQLCALN